MPWRSQSCWASDASAPLCPRARASKWEYLSKRNICCPETRWCFTWMCKAPSLLSQPWQLWGHELGCPQLGSRRATSEDCLSVTLVGCATRWCDIREASGSFSLMWEWAETSEKANKGAAGFVFWEEETFIFTSYRCTQSLWKPVLFFGCFLHDGIVLHANWLWNV